MKTLAALLAALVLTPSAGAAPPGFVRALELEPAASFVARKSVTVWCATSTATWAAGLRSIGLPASAHGTANLERREVWLEKVICDNLAIAARYGVATDGYRALAPSVLVLVHESIHLRGVLDEGKADCVAARAIPNVAPRFFGRRPLVVSLLVKEVARYRDASKPVYRTVC